MPTLVPAGPRAVSRFRLPNGLSVLLAPIPGSPTASTWVWYRVGSKNEWPGVTGASHWVEHMLFLGSPRYAKGEIDRAIVGVGGTLNAFTSPDVTAYYTTVPREHVRVSLDIESDRMSRALIAPVEVERERTIIRSEREGAENWPEFRAEEELLELAFRRHPYQWDALGRPEDIRALTPDDLRAYYRRFYGPRNATLVVAGGIDPAEIRREVVRRFGPIAASGDDPTVQVKEPEPTGERRGHVGGPGTTPYLTIGYRAPAILDPDAPAAIVLDLVLGGENSLFRAGRPWARSSEHPSSRLYRALVDTGLAVEATSQFPAHPHPTLLEISAQAAPGVRLERIEAAIDRVAEGISKRPPTTAEMSLARKKMVRGAEMAYEGASGTGFRLGYFATLGPAGFERELLRRLLRVSAKDVQRAARTLLRPERRVVVEFEPTSPEGSDA